MDSPGADPMTERDEMLALADCPVGLFMSEGGELCLKTEYGNNEGRIDAYIVSSGEFFWGSHPQTIDNQRKQMVRPIDHEELLRTAARTDAGYGAGFEACREAVAEAMWRAELRRATGKERNIPWSEVSETNQERWLYVADAAITALPAPGGITPVPQLEPWRDELSEIIGHLGAAITQSVANDDQIIMDHVKSAHEIAKIVRRKA